MDGHEDDDDEREEQDVEHVPSQERVGTDLFARQQHESGLRPEHRGVADHVRTHGHRPERKLIPRQEIASEGEQQGEGEQDHADDPVELTGSLVRTVVKDPGHVQEHGEHHEVGAPSVHVSHEKAELTPVCNL